MIVLAWISLSALQGVLMLCDEIHFHHKRSIPRWERIGHPVDALIFALCLVTALWTTAWPYWALVALSCFLVTKDEFVHAKLCGGGESLLHALLFLLHPSILIFVGIAFSGPGPQGGTIRFALVLQVALITLFGLAQLVYWNFIDRSLYEPVHQ